MSQQAEKRWTQLGQCQRNSWGRLKGQPRVWAGKTCGSVFLKQHYTHALSLLFFLNIHHQSLQETIQSDPGWQNRISWVPATASNGALRHKTSSTARAALRLQFCLSKHGTLQFFVYFSKCTHSQDDIQPWYHGNLAQMFIWCITYAYRKVWRHLLLHIHLSPRHPQAPMATA